MCKTWVKKSTEETPFKISLSRDSWNKERSEKEDLLKNMKVQHQQQQTRAQDAEVILFIIWKLLINLQMVTQTKVRTTLYSIINSNTGKYCSVAFI